MSVYVVTSGEYSGYGIEAVFATREAAERWQCDDKNEIEEYELVSNETPLFKRLSLYDSFRRRDGVIASEWKNATRDSGSDIATSVEPFVPAFEVRVQPMCYSDHEYVSLYVEGMDFDKVGKSFSEHKAQIYAEFDIYMEQARSREREWEANRHNQPRPVSESSQSYYPGPAV